MGTKQQIIEDNERIAAENAAAGKTQTKVLGTKVAIGIAVLAFMNMTK